MSRYIAAYDIADDKQREKVARALQQYGERLQKSVFVVDLAPDDIPDFQVAIGALLSAEDCFDVLPVDNAANRPHLRWQADPSSLEPVLIVD